MKKRHIIAAVFFSMLSVPAAFAQYEELKQVEEMPADIEPDDECNTAAEQFIGKQLVADKNINEKRQSLPPELKVTADDLETVRDVLRVVEPGGIITMEFNLNRLTVQLNKYGFITKAYCG